MKHRKKVYPSPFQPFSPKRRYPLGRFREPFQRGIPQADDDFRVDQGNLGFKVLIAEHHFLDSGNPVLRRTALHDVRDIGILSLYPPGRQNLCQKLSRTSDKGASLNIFVGSRSFADEENGAFSVALSRNDLRSSVGKGAVCTCLQPRLKKVPGCVSPERYVFVFRDEWEKRCIHPDPLPECGRRPMKRPCLRSIGLRK